MSAFKSSKYNADVIKLLSKIKQSINIFWFRRDLRIEDNCGLYNALQSEYPVVPLFIFDSAILDNLKDRKDRRVNFIHQTAISLNLYLKKIESELIILHGDPSEVFQLLIQSIRVNTVFTNHDYEPYSTKRDSAIEKILLEKNIRFHTFKDQVIFEKSEIMTNQQKPYTVYTPYKNRWMQKLKMNHLNPYPSLQLSKHFYKIKNLPFPSLKSLGFENSNFEFPSRKIQTTIVKKYHDTRNYPAIAGTTQLGLHLRFGTVSIRSLAKIALDLNETWLGELIWREFFMTILFHFPYVVDQPFKSKYARIEWRNDPVEFEQWCQGKTGYPMVDAGMRELNSTGYMHNRVRMVTASFLTKHLLIDWRWGERYFAEKLLDYELASNNGNWQWAAGCGCDAAPYFRIFNPKTQMEKFDPTLEYIKKWIPEYETSEYPTPIVDHKYGRERALSVFKLALNQ